MTAVLIGLLSGAVSTGLRPSAWHKRGVLTCSSRSTLAANGCLSSSAITCKW